MFCSRNSFFANRFSDTTDKKPQSAVEFEIQAKNTDTGEGGDGDNCMQVLKVALNAFFSPSPLYFLAN